jgi:hypothetical protein
MLTMMQSARGILEHVPTWNALKFVVSTVKRNFSQVLALGLDTPTSDVMHQFRIPLLKVLQIESPFLPDWLHAEPARTFGPIATVHKTVLLSLRVVTDRKWRPRVYSDSIPPLSWVDIDTTLCLLLQLT